MSDSLIAAIMGYTLFFVILVIGLAVVSLVAYWKIFVKAGKEGWEGIFQFTTCTSCLKFPGIQETSGFTLRQSVVLSCCHRFPAVTHLLVF